MLDEERMMDELSEKLKAEDDFGPLPAEQTVTKDRLPLKSGRSSFFIFTVTILVSLSLLLLLMFGVLKVTSKDGEIFGSLYADQTTGEGGDHSIDHYLPTEADDGRLLLMLGGGEEPLLTYILRIDPKNGVLTVLSLPGSSIAGEMTLADARAESESRCLAAVEELLGEGAVDRYLSFTFSDAAALVTELGGMEWIFTDRYESDRLVIPVGSHRLDGETVLTLMAEGDEGEGDLPDSADILAAFIGQQFTLAAFDRDDGLFQAVAAHSGGNVSIVDYHEKKQFFRWTLHMNAAVRTVILTGEEREGGTILSDGELALAGEKLGITPPVSPTETIKAVYLYRSQPSTGYSEGD